MIGDVENNARAPSAPVRRVQTVRSRLLRARSSVHGRPGRHFVVVRLDLVVVVEGEEKVGTLVIEAVDTEAVEEL